MQGARAAIFLGSGERPAMIAALAREPRPGYIALRAFLPPDTPGSGPVARFANVTVRPNVVAFDFGTVPADAPVTSPGWCGAGPSRGDPSVRHAAGRAAGR